MIDFLKNNVIKNDMYEIKSNLLSIDWLKNSTVLVTGAYGMLASYLVYFLIFLNEQYPELNIKILCQGRNKDKMRERFGIYMDKAYFCYVADDICQEINIEEKIDYIIHAASLASSQYYQTNPVDVILPNTVGTHYLLELAKENNVKGFLFFSSGDVYGKIDNLNRVHTERDFGYIDILNVRSCYGESKRLGETMCKAYYTQYGVPINTVRIGHTYGPTMDIYHDERVFAEFVKNIVDGQDIIMKSDGLSERYFCYITDAVDAFLKILHCGKRGEAYNMMNLDASISIKELAYLMVGIEPENKLKVIHEDRDNNSVYMECPVKKYPIFDVDRLVKLGWNPKVSIEEGFKRTVMSFKGKWSSL